MTRHRAASMKGASTQEMKWGFMPGLDDTMQMNLTDKGARGWGWAALRCTPLLLPPRRRREPCCAQRKRRACPPGASA
jgi:hypothetical protein